MLQEILPKEIDIKMKMFRRLAMLVFVLGVIFASAQDKSTAVAFDPKNFAENSAQIDNPWWPLQARTQFVYEGFTVENGEQIPHRIVFTVTDLVKVINGVRCRVIWDRDYSDGNIVETELAFFAQDKDGNVWHLGQYYELYDHGEFLGGRAWMVGHAEGTRAGIMMQANPQEGSPSYSEGFAPAPYYWSDFAQVSEMGQKNTVPYGSFDDVMVVNEWNEDDAEAIQVKYYARGLGNIRVGWGGTDQGQETLELVDVIEYNPEEFAEIRAEALGLETRAYVYATTKPAEVLE
jgi:hypothetical protein